MNFKISTYLTTIILLSVSVSMNAYSAQHFNFQIGDNTITTAKTTIGAANSTLLSNQPSTNHTLHFKNHVKNDDEPQRQRAPRLTPDSLVIIGIGTDGKELVKTVIPDPRIMHTEVFNQDGSIESGATLYLPSADLNFTLPGQHPVNAIQIYQLDWDGKHFNRNLLGEVSVPK